MTEAELRVRNATKLAAAKSFLGVYWLGHPMAVPPKQRKRLEREKAKDRQKVAARFIRQA